MKTFSKNIEAFAIQSQEERLQMMYFNIEYFCIDYETSTKPSPVVLAACRTAKAVVYAEYGKIIGQRNQTLGD